MILNSTANARTLILSHPTILVSIFPQIRCVNYQGYILTFSMIKDIMIQLLKEGIGAQTR